MSKHFESIKSSGRPFLIAEVGVNYYDIAAKEGISPIKAAERMIEEAAKAGTDAVKFQSYKAEKIAVKDSPAYWDQTEESCKSQFELFSKYDSFNEEDFAALARHCERNNVVFLSTPFDFEAADYLDKLCPMFKVASSDLTNWPFLEHIAGKGKPVLLSTGASNVDEIQAAVDILEKYGSGEICLLHCILSYPTKNEDANLGMIRHIKSSFPRHLVGYSDHTLPDDDMTCLVVAFNNGAKIIEKHFTLDKSLPGNDHYHAMDPSDLKTFVGYGDYSGVELDETVVATLTGEHEKRCMPCEESARENARRSVVAKVDIPKGTTITKDMLTFKRPGTGLSPSRTGEIIGKTSRRDYKKDDFITL